MEVSNLFLIYLPWIFFTIILLVLLFNFIRGSKTEDFFKSRESTIVKSLEERDKAFKATAALNSIVLETLDFNTAAQQIANAIPQLLGYETGVLALVDTSKGVLKRTAISETVGGEAALATLEVPFSNIEIQLTDKDNYCIKALEENKLLHTTRLYDVLRPVISEQNADEVQRLMGTKTTLIFPIYAKDNTPFGTFLVSMKKDYEQITEYEHQTIRNFVDGIRIVLRNATLYTSLAKTTEELTHTNERLRELDKLKNEFVSLASHELRTPMTAIKSYLWMALEGQGGPLNDQQKYYIDRAYKSADRLIKLVNDMLNISRIESGRLSINVKSISLEQLVQEVIEEILPRAQELGVTVTLEQPGELPPVLADPDKIKEVLFNLIGNALKFTPKNGSITLSLKQKNNMIETTVSDTGSGIAPENISKLFQKFGIIAESYASEEAKATSGTGLGLYVSRSIIDLHEGKIWASSEGKGKGTQFTFSLKVFNDEDFKRLSAKYAHNIKEGVDLVHTEV